jgi:hypothetical protein
MTTAFTRTPSGLAEKWRFHQEPTIWVEGPTDIYFYGPMLFGRTYRMEAFHGIENSEALVESLVRYDYPYIVILDGDYGLLAKRKPAHKRIVTLARHSFENYLWEPVAVNWTCLRHARCGENKDLTKATMATVEQAFASDLIPAVILDVAARADGLGVAVLPDKIEPFLAGQHSTKLDAARVKDLLDASEPRISDGAKRTAKRAVEAFLKVRPFMHLLKGHMVLGVLRRLFVAAAAKESGSPSSLSNDVLTQLLADVIWRKAPHDDHRKVRRTVNRRLAEVQASFGGSRH